MGSLNNVALVPQLLLTLNRIYRNGRHVLPTNADAKCCVYAVARVRRVVERSTTPDDCVPTQATQTRAGGFAPRVVRTGSLMGCDGLADQSTLHRNGVGRRAGGLTSHPDTHCLF